MRRTRSRAIDPGTEVALTGRKDTTPRPKERESAFPPRQLVAEDAVIAGAVLPHEQHYSGRAAHDRRDALPQGSRVLDTRLTRGPGRRRNPPRPNP